MVAIAMLSCKDFNLLSNTLSSYKKHGLLELIKEKLIFFQNPSPEKQALAKKYGFKCISCNKKKFDAGASWKTLLNNITSKYALMLEDDYPIIESQEEMEKQLKTCLYLLKHNKVSIIRLIHNKHPGDESDLVKKYMKYYPGQENKIDFLKFIKRKMHAGDSRKVIGASVYVHKHPEKIHPHEIIKYNDHCFITSSKYLAWRKQSVFINKDWALNILDKAKSGVFNTQKTMEKALNGNWWNEQNFPIAVCTGLFSHQNSV
jgi:hypothetical protein